MIEARDEADTAQVVGSTCDRGPGERPRQALVDAGVRLDLRTYAGLTPHDLALLYRYDDLAGFLAAAERA